jgi:long-subunit fatty acid transport protein
MTQEIQGIFDRGSAFAGSWRGPIEKAFFDFEITTRALAAGYRVSDRLSLGVGLSYFDSATYFVGDEYLPADATLESYFAPSSFLPEQLSSHVRADVSGGDWGLAAGFLWSVSRTWKLGGVYREGPKMKLGGVVTFGPANPDSPPGQSVHLGFSPWHFPDVYGLGLSYRSPDGHWTTGFEWTRVEYSTVIESLVPELNDSGTIENANEFHLGGEYAFFVGTSVVAVRLGAWHDPDHLVRQKDDRPFAQAETVPGDDELHISAGIGVAFDRFQIDLGADFSERKNTTSISAIYSF